MSNTSPSKTNIVMEAVKAARIARKQARELIHINPVLAQFFTNAAHQFMQTAYMAKGPKY